MWRRRGNAGGARHAVLYVTVDARLQCEDTGMRNWRTNIEITWVSALPDAGELLARSLTGSVSQPVPVVPASLRQDDFVTQSIRGPLRDRGIRTVVVTPRSPAALLTRRDGAAWTTAEVEGTRWRLDARLEEPWVAIAIVDAGSHTGPFALDLPARFLHPADRIRLAARPDRLRLLADIAAIAPPVSCLVLTPIDRGWLSVTTRDPIAAELWALGLAERFHPADVEMQGPWEEPAVQRATELGLGVRIPEDMHIAASVSRHAPMAQTLLRLTAERLGISLDAETTTG